MKQVTLIYNVSSGGKYEEADLRERFKAHGFSVQESFTVRELTSAGFSASVARGDIIAVVGGDGTMNSTARHLAKTDATMLPLPGGTFNHFVRDIGGTPDIDEVLARAASGRTKLIDISYVNDELFLNNSNIGLYPFSLIARKTLRRFVGKWVAALVSAFDQLSRFRRHHLVIDGKDVRSPFVFVGNGVYDITAAIIPARSDLTDEHLTVMIATSKTRRHLFGALFAVLKGDVKTRSDFDVFHVKDLVVEPRRSRIPISLDGEVKHVRGPLHYRVEAKALKIVDISSP